MSARNLGNKYFEEKVYLTSKEGANSLDLVINPKNCRSYKETGELCDRCFNREMLAKMKKINSLERLDFLNYQLNKYSNPVEWLRRTLALIEDNEDEFDSFGYKTYLSYVNLLENGIVQLSQENESKKKSSSSNENDYINQDRISELSQLKSPAFDFTKLVKLCEDLNVCYRYECYLAVAMLLRAILDHVPPVFGVSDFKNVYSQNGSKSFKEHMEHLDKSLRKIADGYLHNQIRKKESLPNKTQVNFSQDIDALLAEIIRKVG